MIQHFVPRLKRARRNALDRYETRSLPANEYSFSADYCSQFFSDWERFYTDLKGRAGVRMLEIGCYEGRSTLWLLDNVLTAHDAKIICLDACLRLNAERRFNHNIALHPAAHKVEKHKARSCDALPDLPDASFDAIYIDGSHLAHDVLFDAIASWRLLKPGGLLLFDDYAWQPQMPRILRPQIAIDLVLEALAPQLEILHHDYQVLVRKI